MKLIDLIKARKVIEAHQTEKLPAVVAYKIMKFMKTSETEDAFYNEKMREIIDKYAAREDGQIKVQEDRILIKPECMQECNEALEELQNTETENPKLCIKVEELSAFQLSVAEVSILDEFIEL